MRDVPTTDGMNLWPTEDAGKKSVKALGKLVWVSARMCVQVCSLLLAVIINMFVDTHPLVKEVSVTLWNCLCCVGCCHCWLTSWTSIFSASSATQAWTAASWAAPSSLRSPLLLWQSLTHPWRPRWCWHHRSMCAWARPRRCRGGFRCRYSARARQCCCGESHFGPCQRLPRQAPSALAETQTEVELERDMKKKEFHFHSCLVKSCVCSFCTIT